MKFRATLEQSGKTATGVEVPSTVVDGLGAGKRPLVVVTIGGHSYRSSIATMDGRFMLGVSAENREKAGVAGGDVIDVDVVLDSAPRTVDVPKDFAAALRKEPKAKPRSNRSRQATRAGTCRRSRARRPRDEAASDREVDRGAARQPR